jgi:hypothetical protein
MRPSKIALAHGLILVVHSRIKSEESVAVIAKEGTQDLSMSRSRLRRVIR